MAQNRSTTAEWLGDLSFRTKLLIGICGVVLLTGGVITWLAHRSARQTTEALVDSLFREVSGHAVTHTRNFVLRASPLVDSLRKLAGNGLAIDDSDRLAGQLLDVLKANEGLGWVYYGDAQGNFTGAYRPVEGGLRINQSQIVDGHTRLVERDVLPDGSHRLFKQDNDSGYDPRRRPYYLAAQETGRLVWLPPYVFFNQRVPGISCAAPVYTAQGDMRGVVSIDFDLKGLSEFIASLAVSENSQFFLFTTDEILLAHSRFRDLQNPDDTQDVPLPKLADAHDPLVDAFRQAMQPAQLRADRDAFTFFELTHNGQEYLASTTAFNVGDDLSWVVGAIAPKADFLGDVWRSQALALAVAAAAVLAGLLLAVLMANRISSEITSLIQLMHRVGQGDLDAKADFRFSREFRDLSQELNRMIGDLRDRLRLRHSLDVAMEVQQGLLPKRSPLVERLDVAGHSTYCDETGGDYYDFMLLDETSPDTVLVALGDVMGHGIGSALVMAGARAVLRDRADTAAGLSEWMERLNRLLSADHEGTRFMTMHLAILNTCDNTYRWVSAGHDPAIAFDPNHQTFDEPDVAELPLGVDEDTQYVEHVRHMRPDEVIVIGTDGLWESPNASGELFGKDRLRDVMRRVASEPASGIVDAIVAELSAFRGDTRQVDDITFVVIKAHGSNAKAQGAQVANQPARV